MNPEADPSLAPNVASSSSAAQASESAAQPVGAVNSGSNPTNGAFSTHQLNAPALVISALAVLFATVSFF